MGALSGKIAIVTGATSGIGERIAEAFVEEGALVVAAARREAEGAALAQRLGLHFVCADVAKEEDVKAVIAAAVSRHGRIDCLVNNAASPQPIVGVAESDLGAFDAVMGVNVRGVLAAMKHVAPIMAAQKSGSIINISSIAAHRGGVSGHIYSASKGAVLALTRSVAIELAEQGVRVNSLSPGAIVTGIFAKGAGVEGTQADAITGLVKELFAHIQPIPRAGLPEDIARAAVFLASDGSSFVTGQDLIVDGGMTATTRGWSEMAKVRGQLGARLRQAAEEL